MESQDAKQKNEASPEDEQRGEIAQPPAPAGPELRPSRLRRYAKQGVRIVAVAVITTAVKIGMEYARHRYGI